MKQVVLFSVYDTVAKLYSAPVCALNEEMLAREMRAVLLRGNHPFNPPGDFVVRRIGLFDEDDGVVAPELPRDVFNLGNIGVRVLYEELSRPDGVSVVEPSAL